jgi:hypothetical protein
MVIPAPPKKTNYLTTKQAAEFMPVPVPVATITRWAREGVRGHKLKGCRVGKRLYFLPADLEEFLAKLNG